MASLHTQAKGGNAMADKPTRKTLTIKKAAPKEAKKTERKGPVIQKVGDIVQSVGELSNPALKDVLAIRRCINCGQGSRELKFDAPSGCKPEDVKIHCPKCGHIWTIREEKSPHRLL